MGYEKHHSIIVISSDKGIKKPHKKAMKIFDHLVSNIIHSGMNGVSSFFIAPDGSKEGWTDSFKGDERRDKFIQYLNKEKNVCCQFVEVFIDECNMTGISRKS